MPDSVKIKGWVDYLKKDMDVTLDAIGLKYSAFLDYMPQEWMPQSVGLDEALINSKVTAVSKSNDLLITVPVIFDQMTYSAGSENNPLTRTLKTTIEYLKQGKDKAQLEFQFPTKMDNPVIDPKVVKKTLKKMLTNDFGLAANLLINALQSAKGTDDGTGNDSSKQIKDLISGFLGGSKSK